MDATTLEHLNKSAARVNELLWLEAALVAGKPLQVLIDGRNFDAEAVRLVILAQVREQLDSATKYFNSL